MQTGLSPSLRKTEAGREAEEILRKCLHCGFCTATCPTYQMFGDEADGPRGRIYLIKQLLEGQPATAEIRLHLDRCLLCRSCETTCPSGVRYGRLLEIGRQQLDEVLPPGPVQRAKQAVLRNLLSRRALFTPLFKAGQSVRSLLPAAIRQTIPPAQPPLSRPRQRHVRRMLVLEGCVQPAMAPRTNAAAA
ncbi:MAG: 4Fe-4S dicluster domain-containing protein, partial [Pseudomonadota bacterium]|nr:4Fe-4S dicluster domain-containing protein [Pseudomonadota bacterium]